VGRKTERNLTGVSGGENLNWKPGAVSSVQENIVASIEKKKRGTANVHKDQPGKEKDIAGKKI